MRDFGGTQRERDPADTLRLVQPWLAHCGITRVADVTGMDTVGIPVAICHRPNGRNLAVTQGKGITIELARVSAIMESIEDHYSERTRAADLRATIDEAAGHGPAIDPRALSPGVYPLPPAHVWDWLVADDIASSASVLVPRAAVVFDTTEPRPWDATIAVSTNGLASGNTRDEAICHALYELIERDAFARWVARASDERASTQLDLRTVTGVNAAFVERFDRAGLEVVVWGMDARCGISAFRCIVRERGDDRGLGIFGGMGAHASPRIALSRALTEAAQSRLTVITGARDDVAPEQYFQAHETAGAALLDCAAQGGRAFVDTSAAPLPAREQWQRLVEDLRALGARHVAVVDLAPTDAPFSVVHVVVPELLYVV